MSAIAMSATYTAANATQPFGYNFAAVDSDHWADYSCNLARRVWVKVNK